MKKSILALILALSILMLAGCTSPSDFSDQDHTADSSVVQTPPQPNVITLGDLGITLELPEGHGLEPQESKLNAYFATSLGGNYAVIVNFDEKGDYTLEEYANDVAIANNAQKAELAEDGNYYFTYSNEGYHFYTAVRQTDTAYYRIAFYCFEDDWASLGRLFANWAATIKMN